VAFGVERAHGLLVQYDHTVRLGSFRASVIETRCIPNTRGIRAAFAVEVPIGGEVCRMTGQP